ncbi:helix-turn-helix domain-containing protein [Streptomyces tendae]|nr:helix-turn-helix transcriptional regulator [Streptomyces tendae]
MGARPEETPVDQRDCGLLLSPREHRLISLLWAGHTDASAAHRMGISPRTVTNILRSLMDRTGVNNRFQLGVVLGSHFALRHTPDMRAPDDGPANAGPSSSLGACQDTSREEYCPVGSVVGMA